MGGLGRWIRDRQREIPEPVRTVAEYANPVTSIIKLAGVNQSLQEGDLPGALGAAITPMDLGAGEGDPDNPLDTPNVKMLLIAGGIAAGVFVGAVAASAAWNIGKNPTQYALNIRNSYNKYKEGKT